MDVLIAREGESSVIKHRWNGERVLCLLVVVRKKAFLGEDRKAYPGGIWLRLVSVMGIDTFHPRLHGRLAELGS